MENDDVQDDKEDPLKFEQLAGSCDLEDLILIKFALNIEWREEELTFIL